MDGQMNGFPQKRGVDPNAYATGPVRPMMGPGGPMMNMRPGMGPVPGQYMNMGPRPNMMHPGAFQTNGPQPSNMTQNEQDEQEETAEPEKLQKIKVDLSDKERGFYSNLISKVEPEGSGRINGKQAVAFFKTSGVNVNMLKSIWKTCARTNVESLSRDEFYLALKLIAYAQNGIPPTEESVLAKIEVPFPQFRSDSSRPGGGMGMQPPVAAPRGPTLADHLPDMNQLNVMALSQSSGNSLIPGMDEHIKQREVEKAQEKMMSNSNSPWFMRPEDVQKYNNIFDYFNKSRTGVLSFEEAKDAFMQTQLEEDVLEQIWSMTDSEEAGEFDRKMFCMAMHILYKVKLGAKCPTTMPHVIKACVTSYFSDQNKPQMTGPPNMQMNGPPNMQMGGPPNMQMNPPGPNMQMNRPMNQNQGMPPQNRPTNQGNMGGMMGEIQNKAEEDPFSSELKSQSRPEGSLLSIEGPNNMGGPIQKQQNSQMFGMNSDMGMPKGGNGLGMPNMGDSKRMDQFSSNHGSSNSLQGSMSNQNDISKTMMEQTIKEQERMIQSRKEDISALNSMHSNNNQLLSSLREKSAKLREELNRLNSEYKSIFSKVAKQNEEIK